MLCFKTPMESHGKPFSPGKRLFELLEERQEPFLLDVYLMQNGYPSNLLKSQTKVKCWPTETRKFFGFSSHGIKRWRKGKVFTCALPKLANWKLISNVLNMESRVPGNGNRCVLSCFTAMGIVDRVSRFNRLLHSCEEVLDGKRHWKTMDDSKRFSPVSVFGLHSDESCSAYNHSTEGENPSTSTLKSDISEEPHHFTRFSNLSHNENGRKDLLPSKQAHLQCRKELKERIWDSLGHCKAEKSRKKQAFSFENHKREIARIAKLIDVDLSGTRREWSHFKDVARKIGLEIERNIFDEIREEAVVEMLGSNCLLKRDSF